MLAERHPAVSGQGVKALASLEDDFSQREKLPSG